MNPPTALLPRRPAAHRPDRTTRLRLETAPAGQPFAALRPAHATHDFLVPNPRPDLTFDPNTLRMLEAG